MELAGALVTKAVEADPARDNLKVRLAHGMFVLATAATPAEQRAALRLGLRGAWRPSWTTRRRKLAGTTTSLWSGLCR